MFKIFIERKLFNCLRFSSRENCSICQLYWCFHRCICRKPRQRDLRNCQQKRDLSKGDTVWWALQNCMFLGGQRDIKRWACVWSRVVHICGVLPCLSYELLATLQGACSAQKRPAKYGRKKIDWRHTGILSNHDDARDQLFRIFPSDKTGTRRREHRVYWFPASVYWFPICDVRNRELLNSMMTQICSRNRNRPSSKKQIVFGRTKPPTQKGVNLEGLGGWTCQRADI